MYKDLTNRAEFIKLIQEEGRVIPIIMVKRMVVNEGFRDIISDTYQRS